MVDTMDPKKPRPPRRRATPKAAGTPSPRKRAAPKADVATEEPVTPPAAEEAEGAAPEAPKPAAKPKAPPKPRSTKRTAPRKAPPRKPAAITAAPAPVLGKHGLDRVGGKWGVASILGSLAAAAGLTAALLSLKGSSAKRDGNEDGEQR
ncbi:hypothetical protein [Sphingomonas sp. SORGH_AS_0879]|uniref:hypothetical protein n=1 Tax=Sphingomonas sp. SORGH_AS_0879 TaxID=3041790 RepID=UPI002780BF3C|nr:hypothetical protein [Sphingomonas sp. SORGH_AS_0879]MDQ1230429.1 type IV secretory pathway VirB10-like protein [Sphingomonas sp. SORGH_AS_0879]